MRTCILWLCLFLTTWAADKAHTMRTAQIKKYVVEWKDENSINGFNVDFFDGENEWLGGVTLLFPSNYVPKAGRTVSLKEIESVSLRCPEKPFSVGGRPIYKLTKEFSAELKPGGAFKFWIQGKESFMDQEWDVDVRADLKLPPKE